MTNRVSVIALAVVGILSLSSCRNEEDEELIGNWVRVSDLDGKSRSNASSFVLDGIGYLVGGYDGEYYYNDTWAYNPNQNSWTQKSDFIGSKRSSAVGFATNTAGYVGTGYDGLNKLNDFYQYNPKNNAWTAIADFPGTGRYAAIAFGIGNNAYVGTGYDGGELKDFYKYEENTGKWSTMVSLGGSKRRDAAVFLINNIAYIGFGSNNGSFVNDFWAFDASSETWTRKADSKGEKYEASRSSPAAFSIGGNGYVTTGSNRGVSNTTWAYNPNSNSWSQKSNFKGSARESACAFTISDKGYVVSGNSGSSYFDDIWTFYPNQKQNND